LRGVWPRKNQEKEADYWSTFHGLIVLLILAACGYNHALSCFLILNDVLARPYHWEFSMSDMLSVLITQQMAKDPSASESIRLENRSIFPAGTGIFVAGETRDTTLTGINSASELDIIAGAVIYTDGAYDEQDKDAFSGRWRNGRGR
jgi:hypothetical protein